MSEASGRILIVDDEKVNRQILVSVLEQYETVVAATGEQALNRINQEPVPELVLLDVIMPGMDGISVCQQLKANPDTANIPVIFITVKDDAEEEERGFAAGAVDYICKPFSPAIVRARVSTHLRLKQQTDLLEHLYQTDPLTGIPNRRAFEMFLARHQEAGSEMALVLMDVDYFKSFNDNYGHAAGDLCLKKVATAMHRVAEDNSGLLARIGGEEFAFAIPEYDLSQARLIAEQLRLAVSGLEIEHHFSTTEPVVTVSAGLAVVTPEHYPNLLEQADKALYRAKEAGRNRVIS